MGQSLPATTLDVVLPQPGCRKQIGDWTVLNEGRGYGMRIRRVEASSTFSLVIMEYTHPNAGMWLDAVVFINTPESNGWFGVSFISPGQALYGRHGKDNLVSQYPWTEEFFEVALRTPEPVDFIPEKR